MLRRASTVGAATLLAWLALAAVPAAAEPFVACTGDPGTVTRLDMTIAGTPTYGLYAVPDGRPRGLVVVAHGYSHTVYSWVKHLSAIAARNRVIAVAMNYRGSVDLPPSTPGGLPKGRGWQVQEGAEDSVAVARLFDRQCPGLPTIDLYSVSMGGNTAGLAAAMRAKRHDGRPLWRYWFSVEGAANVTELYMGARVLAPFNSFAANARDDIEREMGGTFEQRSGVYAERTVVNRVDDIAASGLLGVVLVHGVADGLVPYNQSVELRSRLREKGIPTDIFSVGTRGAGEPGTTADGYVTGQVPNFTSPFAGHASESSQTHVVGLTGFDRLAAYFNRGEGPCDRAFVVDGNTGVVAPDPATAEPRCPVQFDEGDGPGAGGGSLGVRAVRGPRSCSTLRLRLRPPRGQRIVAATVYVNGRRARRARRRSIRTLFVRNVPARSLRVRVVAITSQRRLLVSNRRYRACRATGRAG